jgi:hypothetical protein
MISELARQYAAQAWSSDCRYVVVTATLRRPGRGQSNDSANKNGWRIETRRLVLSSLDGLAAEVVQELASGACTGEETKARIAKAGFADAIRIAASEEELTGHLADVMRSGDNVWTDCSPDSGGVLYMRWWFDSSHPRHTK